VLAVDGLVDIVKVDYLKDGDAIGLDVVVVDLIAGERQGPAGVGPHSASVTKGRRTRRRRGKQA